MQLIRGFRLNETLVFDILDVPTLANIKAIIGHPYKIIYYSHSDNTNRWDYVNKVGSYNYLNQNITLPYYNATLTIRGTHLRESIPHYFIRQRVLNHADWTGAAFSLTEKGYALRAMNHTDWLAGNFSTVEQTYGHVPASAGIAAIDGYVSDGI